MADESVVSEVIDLLPADAKVGDAIWDAAKVESLLDAGNSVNKLMARFWNAQAAATATMIDISESGSSRSLSTIHENAVRMARYWDDRLKAEEDAETAVPIRNSAVSHRARRV